MKINEADLNTAMYSEKNDAYYRHARREIEPLLPDHGKGNWRVLEIGCSEGFTLEWLKKSKYCSWSCGIDPYAQVNIAERHIDQFFNFDIEKNTPNISDASLDIILCLDVLEHLVDPWEVIRRIERFLKPGGILIISAPNLRNYRIVFDLLFKGRFRYSQSGPLDRTHLRFFTREGLVDLAQSGVSKVTHISSSEPMQKTRKILSWLGAYDLLVKQYLLVAQKPSASN